MIVEEHDSVTSLIAAVESGRGVALVAGCMACMVGPRLKILSLTPDSAPIVVGAACRVGAASTVVEKFIAAADSNGAARPPARTTRSAGARASRSVA